MATNEAHHASTSTLSVSRLICGTFSKWLFGSVAAVACLGCGQSADQSVKNGFLLGFDDGGIAVIALDSGSKVYLRVREKGHYWRKPVWHKELSRFICIDDYNSIWAVPCSGSAKLLYSAPKDCEVSQVTVMPRGQIVFLLENNSHNLPKSVMVLDSKSLQSTLVAKANIDSGSFLQPIGDTKLVVACLQRPNESQEWQHLVSIVDINGKTPIREVLTLDRAAKYAASADGNQLFIAGPGDKFQLYDLASSGLHEIKPKELPGKAAEGMPVLFDGGNAVVVFRERDVTLPLGCFSVDLQNMRVTRVSSALISAPTFLTEFPSGCGSVDVKTKTEN
jgi:hypothetical protein